MPPGRACGRPADWPASAPDRRCKAHCAPRTCAIPKRAPPPRPSPCHPAGTAGAPAPATGPPGSVCSARSHGQSPPRDVAPTGRGTHAAGGVPATQRQRAARGRPCNTCATIDHGQPPKISALPSFGASEPCAGANWRTQAMRGCGGCGANHTMLNGAETLFVYCFPDRPAAPCPNQRPARRHRARRFP